MEACPPSTSYRLQKFTRRHRTAVLATAAVGLALVLGAGVAAGQAYRATKAEKLAEEQLQIATEQQRLAKQQAQLAQKQKRLAEEAAEREAKLRMEAENATKEAEAARKRAEESPITWWTCFAAPTLTEIVGMSRCWRLMDRLKGELDAKFSDDVLMKAKLLLAIAETYKGLGLWQESLAAFQKCFSIRRDVLGMDHPETLTMLPDLVDAYNANGRGRSEEAITVGDEGLGVSKRILGPEHPTTVKLMATLMTDHMWDDDVDSAIKYSEEALRLSQKVLGPDDPATLMVMINLSYAYEIRLKKLERADRTPRGGTCDFAEDFRS